ncbi:hypothetical protein [Methylomusa anaerophila]|uniref:RCK N-terminal domain-containing protein n=1 Tax=Methylomusa anaerophila TaxID=1930071 RepID=A0A348AH25_9FIRM|nr:hypothetical protein [Methylomusa anaerophila]BBB90373.1 hypothetical protein MAMMFC1_01021 [Methylomusa anaerophila]
MGETLETVEVVFCGNSVYLCGLAAGLRLNKKLRIRLVDNTLDKAMPELKILHPHVVIAESPAPREVNTLQNTHPGLLLIGIDAATDSLRIFAVEQPVFSVEKLGQVIFQYTKRNGHFEPNCEFANKRGENDEK